MVIYFTLINLTVKGTHSSTVSKELSISLFMSFKNIPVALELKIIFCIDKNFKYLLVLKRTSSTVVFASSQM